MLGFGPLGSGALGSVPSAVLHLTSDILLEVVTEFVNEGLLPGRPDELHHFTSLETAHRILENDDIRLSHAEYSNDQMEMEEAKRIIRELVGAWSFSGPFLGNVFEQYNNVASNLDAFIFCMSMGLTSDAAFPQDMLSQWRAYGQDGRGICLTLDGSELGRRVSNTPGLRINPVIYDRHIQERFIRAIIDRAVTAHQNGTPNADQAAVAALVYATPLMKDPGFAEEREWRLIFMPPANVTPHLYFHARRDFIAPFITLNDVWANMRPTMLAIPELADTLPAPLQPAQVPPLIPVTRAMVGPSGHQLLNRRAIQKLVAQSPHRAAVHILSSTIPYRSLA